MLNEYGMYQGYNIEGAQDPNISIQQSATANIEGYQQPSQFAQQGMPSNIGCGCEPMCSCEPVCGVTYPVVYECGKERQVHRQIVHNIPHVCPVNTRIINHHICRHTYSPCYTCCEENVLCNVHEGSCCNF